MIERSVTINQARPAPPRWKRLQPREIHAPPTSAGSLFPAAPVFFVTCCTYRRRNLLANESVHSAFITFAECAQRDFDIAVGRYVIMPDHLHFFVAGPNEFDLGVGLGP